jgi:3-hydroxyacyl-CoA dehydrogenase/enoyl-CoA hydratase/carnithine racemase
VSTEFRVERADDVALVRLVPDGDSKPIVFGEAALRSLGRALGELERDAYTAAVFVGTPTSFSAGADVDEFRGITPERAREGSRAGHELFGRIRSLPFPTLAAISGTCLGGGLELALHCTARTAAAPVRAIAFPEVFLGLFPAWGGTQLLPRLVGPDAAVQVVVANALRQNRMLTTEQGRALGVLDAVFAPESFLEDSVAFAKRLAAEPLERPAPDWSEAEAIFRRARTAADDQVHGATPAPYVALELIEGAQAWSLEEGLRREEDAIAELLPGRQAQASLYAFRLVEQRAKRQHGRPDAEASTVRKVGIVGGGLMARQIATLFLRRLELPIVIRDIAQSQVDDALADIAGEIRRLAAKGRYDAQASERLAGLVTGTTSYDGFADCDLVLEAVFEELTVKRKVFSEVEAVVGPRCVLATNTSSLSVTAMGSELRYRQRLVGLHFFNPVALMPLVEIVRARDTDEVTVATAFDVATALRKRAVLVADAPGFVVNRVLTRMTRVIMDAVEHATPVEEVDEAVMSIGMPMAPSVLLAMVGPRVANHVLETLHAAWPDRFPLSPTLANYAAGIDEVVIVDAAPWSRDEVVEHVLKAVADEVHRILDERVVEEAADVDTCLLLGAGWPFFLGGITKHLDQTGLSERLFGHTLAAMPACVASSRR